MIYFFQINQVDWGLVSVLTAIVIALVTWKLMLPKKSLTYSILSIVEVISLESDYADKLKIYFEDRLVQQVNAVTVNIENSGSQPIINTKLQTDYEDPIRIGFTSETEILGSEVIAPTTPGLQNIPLLTNKHYVDLPPMLLNPKDSITIKIIVTNFVGSPKITTRIVGIKEITNRGIVRRRQLRLFFYISIIASVTLFSSLIVPASRAVYISYFGMEGYRRFISLSIGFMSSILGGVLAAGSILREGNRDKS